MAQPTNPGQSLQLPLLELSAAAADYAVFDLETTGLHVTSCQIIEFGWCTVRNGRVGSAQSVLVSCATGVPAEIQALTGISSAMLHRDGRPLEEALDTFLDDTVGLPLVGHNVLRFDMQFIEAACRATSRIAPMRSRYRDTAALYKAHRLGMRPRAGQDHWSFAHQVLDLRAPGVRYKLGICCDTFGIQRAGVAQHRAAGDVSLTQQLYHHLLLVGSPG
ncbi:MAG: 3'-5' exonuclease [Dehalococcoidia bacterium]